MLPPLIPWSCSDKDAYEGDRGVTRDLAFLRAAAADCFHPKVLCADELSADAVHAFTLVLLSIKLLLFKSNF